MRLTDKPLIQVAAGVLRRADGELLLAQRPVGKIAAGYWEFPGGKIERGESPRQALDRELHEELGIRVRTARPLIRFRHEYSDRSVVLDTWLITDFDNEIRAHENQEFAWVPVSKLATWPQTLPTVAPIAGALSLPEDYVFTPPRATLQELTQGLRHLPSGALLRLRQPQLDDRRYEQLAAELLPAARRAGLRLILDRAPERALALQAEGWHATSGVLSALAVPPLAPKLRFASCHDPEELARARVLGFSAAVLGPVQATASHPQAVPIGWAAYAAQVQAAGLPVYALGGVGPRHRQQAFAAYGQGVAGISAYWPELPDSGD